MVLFARGVLVKPMPAALCCNSTQGQRNTLWLLPSECIKWENWLSHCGLPVKSSGPSQRPAREDMCRIGGFRDAALAIYQYNRNSTMQKPSLGYAVLLLFIAQVFQGALVSISCKSIRKYLAVLEIRHEVAVLRCSCPCSAPGVCWWMTGHIGMCVAVKRVLLEHRPGHAEQMTIRTRFWAQVPRCVILSPQHFVAQVAF